jgi:hypothetical protein
LAARAALGRYAQNKASISTDEEAPQSLASTNDLVELLDESKEKGGIFQKTTLG